MVIWGVAVHSWMVLEAQTLDGSRFDDSLTDCCARFAWFLARHLLEVHRLNLHLQVDSIQQRARNLAHVVVALVGRADALLGWVSIVTARTRIHRGHEHERGGVVNAILGA